MTTYKIRLENDWTEPLWNDEKEICRHRLHDEYVVNSKNACVTVVDDFLDAPKKKLTEKDVRADFEGHGCKLSDARVQQIMDYYNGRLALRKKLMSKLDKINESKVDDNEPVVLKFKIPFKMNFFTCEDDDSYEKRTKLNYSAITVTVENGTVEDKDAVRHDGV